MPVLVINAPTSNRFTVLHGCANAWWKCCSNAFTTACTLFYFCLMLCYFNPGLRDTKYLLFYNAFADEGISEWLQSGHLIDACFLMMSGVSVCLSVSPTQPSWPPLLFLPFSWSGLFGGGFDNPSLDGGLELLSLFFFTRFSNSTIFALSLQLELIARQALTPASQQAVLNRRFFLAKSLLQC